MNDIPKLRKAKLDSRETFCFDPELKQLIQDLKQKPYNVDIPEVVRRLLREELSRIKTELDLAGQRA